MGPHFYLHSGLLKIRRVWIISYCRGDTVLEISYQNIKPNCQIWKISQDFPSWNCHESWKVLSENFLVLELRSPGKFCPDEKIVLEFSQNDFTQKWTYPEFTVLEFSSPGTFCSWNFFSRNLLVTINCGTYKNFMRWPVGYPWTTN